MTQIGGICADRRRTEFGAKARAGGDAEGLGKMSGVEVDWLELAVEEGLEEGGGDEGVELALFAGAGEFLAGALAGDEVLLGLERAEALVDENDFDAGAGGE